MLVVIPFCARDKEQAVRLAGWIAEQGGVEKHDCLLAVHKDTDSAGVIEPLTKAFGRIAEFAITDEMIVEREQHAYAANLMWKRTVNHIADMNESQPFLWLEVDSVPIGRSWLDAIAAGYVASGKPFLHDLVKTSNGKSNSGCGVYPAKVRDFTDRLWQLSNVSWDVLLYPDFAPHTAYTPLIQDIGFLEDGKTLPTFPDQASLSIIREGVALFHRCKDGSLIDRLREGMDGGLGINRFKEQALIAEMESITKPKIGVNSPMIERVNLPFDMDELEKLKAEIKSLKEQLYNSIPINIAPEVTKFPIKAKRGNPKGDTRTPEQIQSAKDRMEKVRAGRKSK